MKYKHLIILLIISLFCIDAKALKSDQFQVGDFVYQHVSGYQGIQNTVAVSYNPDLFGRNPENTGYVGTTYAGHGEITIPSTVVYNGITYNVVEIGVDAFHGTEDLTKVILPNSIKRINVQAFRRCPLLASINFPEGLEIINYDAFTYDNSLTEIELPSSLKLIDGYAFCECRGLKRVILKDSDVPLQKPQSYGCYAIFSQTNVDYAYIGRAGEDSPVTIDAKELVLGNAITYISDATFNPATLEKITIPASVKTIRKEAFKDATSLKEVIIEDGDTPIYLQRTVYTNSNGNSTSYQYLYCFQNTALENVYIGREFNPEYNNNVEVDYDAKGSGFAYTKTLKTVTIGPNVRKLYEYSFLRCENLQTVDYANAPISYIGDGCFSDCVELTTAVLPSTLQQINYRAFDSCFKLGTVIIPNGVTSIGESAFSSSGAEEVFIPGSVETIGKYAFTYNKNLKVLTLSEGIKTISENAFSHCYEIEELTIPGSVTLIKADAFSLLSSLKKLKFSDGSEELFVEYDTYSSSTQPKAKPILSQSTKFLEEIYIGRVFPHYYKSGYNYVYPTYNTVIDSPYNSGFFDNLHTVTFGPKIDLTNPGVLSAFENVRKVICLGTNPVPLYQSGTLSTYSQSKMKVYVPVGYVDKYISNNWTGFASVQENIKPTRVTLNKTSASLRKGDTLKLTATVYPSNAADADVMWESSDETIIKVDEDGNVSAIGVGEATISAYLASYENIFAQCKITVNKPLANTISFNSESALAFVGSTTELTISIEPEDANLDFSLSIEAIENQSTNILSYTKEDNKVVVSGRYPGSAKIIAKTNDGSNLSASCIINVCSLSLDNDYIALEPGKDSNLSAVLTPLCNNEVGYVWTSSNSAVASVSSTGTIFAKGKGTATIYCSPIGHEDIRVSCDVEVGTLFDKNLLVETVTSTRESFSVRGYAGVEMYKSLSVDGSTAKVIPISVHTDFRLSDPMALPTYASKLGDIMPGFPEFAYDRRTVAENPTSANRTMFYPADAERLLSQKSVFGIIIEKVTCPDNQLSETPLNATLTINPGRNSSDTYRVAAVITENNVTNISSQYNQIYYNYTSDQLDDYDWQWMSPYCAGGIYGQETIPATTMVYQNVARGIFPSYDGKEVGNNWQDGACHAASISFNLPSTIQNIENCELVVMLIDNKGRVVNTASMPYSQFDVQTTQISSLSLNKSSITLENGKSEQLVASVTPSYISNPAIKWTSSNPEIATVSDGIVCATGVGNATITVETIDGSNLKQSCSVSVYPSAISFNVTDIELLENQTFQLIPNVPDEYLSNANLLWSSSNYGVIDVDQTGVITARSKGQATATLRIWTPSATISADCHVIVNRVATGISLSSASAKIEVGGDLQLTAIIKPTDAYITQVEWLSSDENIATVDNKGLVHGVAQGSAIISAKTTDGSNLSASCQVTVGVSSETITLSENYKELETGETFTLVATVLPPNATNQEIVWSSSDPNVASVYNGEVHAYSYGTAIITATTTDGTNLSAACTVKVVRRVQSIQLSETNLVMSAGEYQILTATVVPDNATNTALSWISTNQSVVKVENGIVVAISDGEADIIVSATDGSNVEVTCHVIVRTLVTEITLDYTQLDLREGEFKQITANVYPDNATNVDVEWSSSDTSVASVSNGLILAHSKGQATITVAALDGSGVKASCTVNVSDNSGIEDVNYDLISVYVLNRTIHIDNAYGIVCRIIQMDGTIVYTDYSDDQFKEFNPASFGTYIVIVGNKSYKVMVK